MRKSRVSGGNVAHRACLPTLPVVVTLALALVVAIVSVGFTVGIFPSSEIGTAVPGNDNATDADFARLHLLGLAVTAPIGAAVYLVGPHLGRALARSEAAHQRLVVGSRWIGVSLVSGLATVPVVVMAFNPRGITLSAPGCLLSLWIIRHLQGPRPIPPGAATAAFLWGATFAVSIGVFLGKLHGAVVFGEVDALTNVDPVAATLPAPIWEELGKGAGVLVVMCHLRDRFDGVVGGLLVGALVGAGFNFCETVRYALVSLDAASYQVWARQWVSGVFAGHVVYTAITGAAVGIALARRTQAPRIVIVAAGFALSALGHFLWNLTASLDTQPFASQDPATELAVSTPMNYLAITGPFIALVFGLLWVAQRREARALREALPVEAFSELGAVRPAEVPVLLSPLLRAGYRVRCLWVRGLPTYVRARRLQRAQIELGIERWKVARAPWRSSREADIRLQIWHLRQRLQAEAGASR